jgi:FkbM family methyltransferase
MKSPAQKFLRKIGKRCAVPFRQISRFIQSRRSERTTYLRNCNGLIHVGANAGQERNYYARLGLNVLWVEPIPSVFTELAANIAAFPKQKALQALLTAHDDEPVELQISSNSGKSSSILPLAEHTEVWPDIEFKEKLILTGITLPTLIKRNSVDLSTYDALLLDTQGAELLILQGASTLLSHFSYIQTEAANFEAYVNCPRIEDIIAFVEPHGFKVDPNSMAGHDNGQRTHYDLVFVNTKLRGANN